MTQISSARSDNPSDSAYTRKEYTRFMDDEKNQDKAKAAYAIFIKDPGNKDVSFADFKNTTFYDLFLTGGIESYLEVGKASGIAGTADSVGVSTSTGSKSGEVSTKSGAAQAGPLVGLDAASGPVVAGGYIPTVFEIKANLDDRVMLQMASWDAEAIRYANELLGAGDLKTAIRDNKSASFVLGNMVELVNGGAADLKKAQKLTAEGKFAEAEKYYVSAGRAIFKAKVLHDLLMANQGAANLNSSQLNRLTIAGRALVSHVADVQDAYLDWADKYSMAYTDSVINQSKSVTNVAAKEREVANTLIATGHSTTDTNPNPYTTAGSLVQSASNRLNANQAVLESAQHAPFLNPKDRARINTQEQWVIDDINTTNQRFNVIDNLLPFEAALTTSNSEFAIAHTNVYNILDKEYLAFLEWKKENPNGTYPEYEAIQYQKDLLSNPAIKAEYEASGLTTDAFLKQAQTEQAAYPAWGLDAAAQYLLEIGVTNTTSKSAGEFLFEKYGINSPEYQGFLKATSYESYLLATVPSIKAAYDAFIAKEENAGKTFAQFLNEMTDKTGSPVWAERGLVYVQETTKQTQAGTQLMLQSVQKSRAEFLAAFDKSPRPTSYKGLIETTDAFKASGMPMDDYVKTTALYHLYMSNPANADKTLQDFYAYMDIETAAQATRSDFRSAVPTPKNFESWWGTSPIEDSAIFKAYLARPGNVGKTKVDFLAEMDRELQAMKDRDAMLSFFSEIDNIETTARARIEASPAYQAWKKDNPRGTFFDFIRQSPEFLAFKGTSNKSVSQYLDSINQEIAFPFEPYFKTQPEYQALLAANPGKTFEELVAMSAAFQAFQLVRENQNKTVADFIQLQNETINAVRQQARLTDYVKNNSTQEDSLKNTPEYKSWIAIPENVSKPFSDFVEKSTAFLSFKRIPGNEGKPVDDFLNAIPEPNIKDFWEKSPEWVDYSAANPDATIDDFIAVSKDYRLSLGTATHSQDKLVEYTITKNQQMHDSIEKVGTQQGAALAETLGFPSPFGLSGLDLDPTTGLNGSDVQVMAEVDEHLLETIRNVDSAMAYSEIANTRRATLDSLRADFGNIATQFDHWEGLVNELAYGTAETALTPKERANRITEIEAGWPKAMEDMQKLIASNVAQIAVLKADRDSGKYAGAELMSIEKQIDELERRNNTMGSKISYFQILFGKLDNTGKLSGGYYNDWLTAYNYKKEADELFNDPATWKAQKDKTGSDMYENYQKAITAYTEGINKINAVLNPTTEEDRALLASLTTSQVDMMYTELKKLNRDLNKMMQDRSQAKLNSIIIDTWFNYDRPIAEDIAKADKLTIPSAAATAAYTDIQKKIDARAKFLDDQAKVLDTSTPPQLILSSEDLTKLTSFKNEVKQTQVHVSSRKSLSIASTDTASVTKAANQFMISQVDSRTLRNLSSGSLKPYQDGISAQIKTVENLIKKIMGDPNITNHTYIDPITGSSVSFKDKDAADAFVASLKKTQAALVAFSTNAATMAAGNDLRKAAEADYQAALAAAQANSFDPQINVLLNSALSKFSQAQAKFDSLANAPSFSGMAKTFASEVRALQMSDSPIMTLVVAVGTKNHYINLVKSELGYEQAPFLEGYRGMMKAAFKFGPETIKSMCDNALEGIAAQFTDELLQARYPLFGVFNLTVEAAREDVFRYMGEANVVLMGKGGEWGPMKTVYNVKSKGLVVDAYK